MIFVTVGNSIKGVEFHRLVREIDEIARGLNEEVVAQIGFIENPPKYVKSYDYLNYVEISSCFQRASMIVGQCGVGTVINALTFKKPIIVVPRSKAFGEHIDDHQMELAEKIRGMEGIFVVDRVEDLRKTILKVMDLLENGRLESHFSEEKARLLSFMRGYVDDCRRRGG
jgi:UDP-N-acetylglucosamine transferase subunit ALG13